MLHEPYLTEALNAVHARAISVARRPCLQMLLTLHYKTPLLGQTDQKSYFAAIVRVEVVRLLARLEVVSPGLMRPEHEKPSYGLPEKFATFVTPTGFAPCSRSAMDKNDLTELPDDADIVRVSY